MVSVGVEERWNSFERNPIHQGAINGSEKRLMKRHHSCVGRASETISCYLPLQTEEPHKRPFSFFDPTLPSRGTILLFGKKAYIPKIRA